MAENTNEDVAGRRAIDENASVGRQVETPTTAATPTTGPASIYGTDGKLTRAGMEHVIRSGGSVTHNGRVIASIAHLPSDIEMAKASGSADEVERLGKEKEAEIDRLQAEIRSLKAKPTTAAPAASTPSIPAKK